MKQKNYNNIIHLSSIKLHSIYYYTFRFKLIYFNKHLILYKPLIILNRIINVLLYNI